MIEGQIVWVRSYQGDVIGAAQNTNKYYANMTSLTWIFN